MSGSRSLIVILIVTLLTIIGVILLLYSDVINLNPGPDPIPQTNSTFPSADAIDSLIERINSGSRSEMASPPKLSFSQGDHITFMLGIGNTMEHVTTFFVSLTQDSGPPSASLELAPAEIEIHPGSVGMINVNANVDESLPKGIYSFTADICTGQPCSHGSEIYSSERFTFRVD